MKFGYRVTEKMRLGATQRICCRYRLFTAGRGPSRKCSKRSRRAGSTYPLRRAPRRLPARRPETVRSPPHHGGCPDHGQTRRSRPHPPRRGRPHGNRLSGAFDAAYREALIELSALCPISVENATNNNDIKWFWQTYARPSITLDLGHLEASALAPVGFVERLEDELLQRVEFVHLHRTNGLRRGLRDPLGADRGLSRDRGGTPPDRSQNPMCRSSWK